MNIAIQAQQKVVRAAYATTNDCNPEYKAQFDILSDLRRASMAQAFRDERGLPPDAQTPYCPTQCACA